MTSNIQPGSRGKEVLKLLLIHRALSLAAMQCLMVPSISRRRLREVLQRLVKTGIVSRKLGREFGGHAAFYELSTASRPNPAVGGIHHTYRVHNDLCSLAHAHLQSLFPEATFLREHELALNPGARMVMRYRPGMRDSLPDLLCALPTQYPSRSISVAVEIELGRKSAKRLLAKFSKFASRTHLDGVLYLSNDEALLGDLRELYRIRIAPTALRIGHYRDNFFLTARCPTPQKLEIVELQNSLGKPVSLPDWMRLLVNTPMDARRDSAFAGPALDGVP